jgi:hypothetical protein
MPRTEIPEKLGACKANIHPPLRSRGLYQSGCFRAPDEVTAARALYSRGENDFVLAKINANPVIEGKATLVEFRQKSVATQPLGDKMKSAVVEFEGVVTFSSDVSWSWQGPTKAGEPQKFEARAEYVDQGQGWQMVEPLGIYPL